MPSQTTGLANAAEITASDSADLAVPTAALYVGYPGDLRVTTANGQTVTLPELVPGWYPISARRIWASGTTASEIVAWW